MPSYNTKEEVEALSTPDPDWTAFLTSSAEKSPLVQMPFRDVIAFWKASPQIPNLPDTSTEFTITAPLRDGHQSEIRIYKPVPTLISAGTKTPLVVLAHGGGFCMGHWSHVQTYAKSIAYLHGVTVASVSYRFAPEHKFPTAHQDVWDTLKYLTSPAGLDKLGGDVDVNKGLVVGGVSAGANIAAVTVQNSILGKEKGLELEGGAKVSGLWLSIPALYCESTVPERYRELWIARKQNKDAKIISTEDAEYTESTYGVVHDSDMFCPGFGHGEKAHTGMPRTFIQVAGQDPLRDDGLIYEKVLRDHGVETKIEVYQGVPHGFADLLKIPAAEKANRDLLKGTAWLLGKDAPSDEQCELALKAAAA